MATRHILIPLNTPTDIVAGLALTEGEGYSIQAPLSTALQVFEGADAPDPLAFVFIIHPGLDKTYEVGDDKIYVWSVNEEVDVVVQDVA